MGMWVLFEDKSEKNMCLTFNDALYTVNYSLPADFGVL